MSSLEQQIAINDTYEIIQEYGTNLIIASQSESTRNKDKFGSLQSFVSTSTVTLKAFPIRVNPSTKVINELGFDENTTLIFYVSTKEMELKSFTFDETLRNRVKYNSKQYNITDFKPNGQFGDKFRSYIFGCSG